MAELRVLAVLGVGIVPSDTAILRADDLGALRGDGIFETMHVRAGRAWMVDEHLARLRVSAGRLDLALPSPQSLAALVELAAAAWPADDEGMLRLVCTRGRESVDKPTVFASVSTVPQPMRATRRDGLAVLTASLGLPADLRQRAPWLLGGAKTLSYAVNMAAQRWALGLGAGDVLWVSSDGWVLEATTSTVVWLDGTTLCTVPAETTGILAGTTTGWLMRNAAQLGWRAEERMITPAALAAADGGWLTSAVRGAAPIRTLDGTPLAYRPEVTARISDALGFQQ